MTLSGKEMWRVRQWFPSLDERAQERLRIFHIELIRWTKKINLISAASIIEADFIHFADSIMGAQFVLEDIKASGDISEIWDFGSGNGFPGAIFSILETGAGHFGSSPSKSREFARGLN